MKFKLIFAPILPLILVACATHTVGIRNEKVGQLKTAFQLEVTGIKRLILDSITAPKPQYTQVYADSTGSRYFTFLNTYTNSIYFFNYNTLEFIKKIAFNKKGTDGIQSIKGYHIKNMDSIYVYNMPVTEIVLANSNGKIQNKISLRGGGNPKAWTMYYPQYYPETVNPFIEIPGKLLLTGQYFFSIPDSMIGKFKITASIDLKTNKVDFRHSYPGELYGSGYNWEGGFFTEGFPELHPDGDKLIFSFPVSHDLFIAGLNANAYRKVYADSNFAGTIYSIDRDNPHKTPGEMILVHYARQDLYAAIKYDKYRKVYYRFLLKGIPNATIRTQKEVKPIAIIVMDENFNYLGETVIGTGKEWYWQNSFVTSEGLNIEYIEKDFD
ncbi:MAG: DUF4221 domain-containing protein, partial [Prolixibacteraceae bacterium]|nr:DUF4221 domain-containing protein [Prolixibacteraceae bacterium]